MKKILIEIFKACLFAKPESTAQVSRYDHLDGYRGYLAILVLLQHSCNDLKLEGDYKIFDSVGNFVGVSGFFALSSFLLTHRLLIEFEKATSMIDVGAIVIKYALKRFCRIYLAFVIYCTAIKFGPKIIGGDWGHSSWISLVSLNR